MSLSLPTKKIGNSEINGIGFGLMGLSAFYGPVPSDEERFEVLDAAFDLGCRTWDSADIYGDSEDLVGKWFKRSGKRDQVFLATKFGITSSGPNNNPAYMRSRIENSLKRLGIPTIDLYYLHRADKNVPIEKTVAAMAELVKEGKVRYIGLSEVTGATLRRAHAVHPIAAVQVEYSPFCLDIEDDEKVGLKKACEELGITIIAYAPLGRGLLTGAYKSSADFADDDFRKSIPKFSDENFPNILSVVDTLKRIGQKHNATAGQVSLAWVMAQGPNVVPIPGTKKVKYLKENLESVKVNLTPEEISEIRAVADKAEYRGAERYPASFESGLLVDTVPLK